MQGGRRIVVNGMFGQTSVRMAFKQKLAGTVYNREEEKKSSLSIVEY